MNYVYDILLNFHEVEYDFYDWNLNDDIIHIRKIPLIKVTSKYLNKMLNFEFSVTSEFLKKISNRTEVFSNKSIKIIKHMCIFSDSRDAIAVLFSDKGEKQKVSRLLLDEKEEILGLLENVNITSIDINFSNKIVTKKFRTRKEQEIYHYIKKQFQKRNYERLKYIYFECFNEEEIVYDKIVNRLNKELNKNWNSCYETIYNILRISTIKKSKNL